MLSNITDIRYLKGVGERRAELLKKLGIDSVDALLSFYPRQYKDLSVITPENEVLPGANVCIKAQIITPVTEHYVRKNMMLYKFSIKSGWDIINVTLFNTKYKAKALRQGSEYLFYGKVSGGVFAKELSSPEIYETNFNKIIPIYHLKSGITSKTLSDIIKNALTKADFTETLPPNILKEYNLCSLEYAIRNIHFPASRQALNIAKNRLVFEELFLMQCGIRYFGNMHKNNSANKITANYTAEFYNGLPFTPTDSQKRSVAEAVYDMGLDTPMNRLLQGDVGSGKTLVAAALCYNTAKNGFASVLMAPTQILAEQHFKTLSDFFKNTNIKCCLLTGATTKRQKENIKAEVLNGNINVIVGTHAVIYSDLTNNNIGLVITDEQHRFGVEQRAKLSAMGKSPHTLVMSATPIPRTLALAAYGDLKISTINEYPKGRQVIESFAIDALKRERAYNYVKKHLDAGRQGYIVCPLVEDGETERMSAESLYKELSGGMFKNYKLGLLHGKMSAGGKEKIMRQFSDGEIELLISTTVIEVGIDVPNSAIMVIENAECFGLSQLHQLRGRVGRGQYKGSCIFILGNGDPKENKRLNIITNTQDGFKIAEEDLKLRGPGDFLGNRQHGLPKFKIADLFADFEVLEKAQKAAENLIGSDRLLNSQQNKNLREQIINMFKNMQAN